MNKIYKDKKIIFLLLASLFTRIFVAYFYSDKALANEWGLILHNYLISGVFGFNVVINENLAIPKFAEVGEIVLPTVFMPPLYLYFIYFIKILSNEIVNLTFIIIFTQIISSLVSILLLYLILTKLASNKFFIWVGTLSFAFFPLNIYATTQISSVSFQIFLNLTFFYYLILFLNQKNFFYLILFSIIGGLLILIRGEYLVFYLFTIFYFFFIYKRNYRFILISLFITLLTISPYLQRNYKYFDTFILTKSFGYNLLKGNNLSFKVEGDIQSIENIKNSKKDIKLDNNYEIHLDNLYKEKALYFIKENPIEYFKLFLLKVFSFLILDFNSTYPNYFNFFHLFPKIFISITSTLGAIFALRKKGFYQFLSIYFFMNVFLFSIFFILPRYSLMLLPVQILLTIDFFKYLDRKFFN